MTIEERVEQLERQMGDLTRLLATLTEHVIGPTGDPLAEQFSAVKARARAKEKSS
jgi:hypothetical protein